MKIILLTLIFFAAMCFTVVVINNYASNIILKKDGDLINGLKKILKSDNNDKKNTLFFRIT